MLTESGLGVWISLIQTSEKSGAFIRLTWMETRQGQVALSKVSPKETELRLEP